MGRGRRCLHGRQVCAGMSVGHGLGRARPREGRVCGVRAPDRGHTSRREHAMIARCVSVSRKGDLQAMQVHSASGVKGTHEH